MEEYQQRVVTEKDDLKIKIDNLLRFLDSEIFLKMEDVEKTRLREQKKVMEKYHGILVDRINGFH